MAVRRVVANVRVEAVGAAEAFYGGVLGDAGGDGYGVDRDVRGGGGWRRRR